MRTAGEHVHPFLAPDGDPDAVPEELRDTHSEDQQGQRPGPTALSRRPISAVKALRSTSGSKATAPTTVSLP